MRIGLLSFHFYNQTAEGLATAKLARALTDRGHTVTVFASPDRLLPEGPGNENHELWSDITVHRVGPDLDLVSSWWAALEKKTRTNPAWDKIGAFPNLAYGCKVEEWAWVKAVTRKVVEVWNSDGGFDVLHTRLNHPISHLAGLQVLRKLRRLPWCAYFSDPWPYHLYPKPYNFTVGPATRYRSERILNDILMRAGSYMFPSTRLRDHLLQGKRLRFRRKAFVAPHLAASPRTGSRPASNGILRIRHSGFLMRERSVGPMFEGVRSFFSRRPNAKILIEFAGRYQGHDVPTAPVDLQEFVGFHGYMEPGAIWNWLQEADVFLLVEAKMKEGIFLPSKLADYLQGGRPILALSPARGVIADCLQSGGGIIVEPDDVNGISLALTRLYDLWRSNRLAELTPSREQIEAVSPDTVMPVYEQAFEAAIRYPNDFTDLQT